MKSNNSDSIPKSLDDAFRKILSDPFILHEFIRMFLPQLSDTYQINQSDIVVEKTEFLSSDLKTKRPDVLFRVKTKDKEIFAFILIEHQSYRDHNMAFRMADYAMRIWEMYMKENQPRSKRRDFKYPQVIPVVFYTGEGRWTPARDVGDKIDCVKGYEQYCPSFRYMVIELSRLDREWLLRLKTVLSKVLYATRVEDVREFLGELKESVNELGEEMKERFYGYLKVLLVGSGFSVSEAEGAVRYMESEEGEGMIRLLSKERKEGKLEAKRESIYEVLEERFGEVPKDIKEAIEKINSVKVLSFLLRKSISVRDFDEFRELLKAS